VFPNPTSNAAQFNLPGVDKVRGTVHGVPAVMAGLWGKELGVVALPLQWDGKAWQVDRAHAQVSTRSVQGVAPDPAVARLIAADHEAAMAYVRTPIGRTEGRLSTYFADVGDTSAVAVVNLAQADYVRRYVAANLPDLAGLPVLSMAAEFKSGSAGPRDYTDVPPGPLALNNAADLYLYPNTLAAVKVSGAQLKAWLEKGAQRFNRIDPALATAQELVNPAFAGFNFDMLTTPEVRYQIDVTAPPGARIVNLRYRGAPIDPAQQFIVATNSFRTSSRFAGLGPTQVVFTAPDSNRAAVVAWIKATGTIGRDLLAAQRSWSFLPVQVGGPVVLRSAPGMVEVARQAGLPAVVAQDGPPDAKGYARYRIELGAGAPALNAASVAAPARTD
jgi:2',3'-cyclic-nucleotide 2'-phosphodiesterase/3'-nucleotidase